MTAKEIAKPNKKQAALKTEDKKKETKDIKKQRIKRNKMDIKVLNLEGNKSQNLKISNDLTELKVNNRLLKYVIDWQINHSKKD
jgi:uncharacterized membrane protein